MLHLLGIVHNDDEEVSPSSQGRQSLRLAVNEEGGQKRLQVVAILDILHAKHFCLILFQIHKDLRLNSP